MKHRNQHKGSVSVQRGPAQDLSRHTPKPAASHLSLPELKKRDAAKVDDDAAALARVQAARPLVPPHRRKA